MSKYSNYLLKKLEERPMMIGNELASLLVNEFSVAFDNARKIIQRECEAKIIANSKPLSFGKGQFVYYKSDKVLSIMDIIAVSKETRKPLYRLLQLLVLNNGIISFYEGLKITASPIEKGSSKVTLLKDLVRDLIEGKFIIERRDNRGVNFLIIRIAKHNDTNEEIYKSMMVRHHEKMVLDSIFIPDLTRWLYECKFVSNRGNYRSVNNPTIGVQHNDIIWDAFSYTKLTGIIPEPAIKSTTKNKQVFVGIDVVINREYSMIDLDGFLARISIHINSVKLGVRKVVPIIFYDQISQQALNTAASLGFLTISLEKIYGTNVKKLIENINSIYLDLNEEHLSERIEEALEKINSSGQNDQLKAVRGALFEALMNPVLSRIYPNSKVNPSKTLTDKGKTREFDIILDSSHPEEIVLIELKGYAGNSYIRLGDWETKGTLKYFFRGSVPIAQAFFKKDMVHQNSKIKAVFITTGDYHSEAEEFIKQMNSNNFKPSMLSKTIYSGSDLLKLLEEQGFKHQAKVIRKFYINRDSEESNS